MKLAIISDIHSNIEALEAVLEVIDERGVDAIYCLGDVVGYGASPAACLDLVRERCAGVVRGNHDEAVATGRGLGHLPKDGQAAALHNREQLSEEQQAYLAQLPLVLEAEGCTFVHATPSQPESWQRLTSYRLAREQFDYFDTEVCFVGHTHIPAVMSDQLGATRVKRGRRYLINVGSVGQPRDHNPRAAFGLFDTEAFEYEDVRCTYPIQQASGRILEAELPSALARRLERGT